MLLYYMKECSLDWLLPACLIASPCQGMVGNPASLLLAHQQLREAASQAYQVAKHQEIKIVFFVNNKP